MIFFMGCTSQRYGSSVLTRSRSEVQCPRFSGNNRFVRILEFCNAQKPSRLFAERHVHAGEERFKMRESVRRERREYLRIVSQKDCSRKTMIVAICGGWNVPRAT